MSRKKRNKKKYFNLFFNISALIAVFIMLIFCFWLYRLDMLPMKYLGIIYAVILLIYLILVLLTIPKKIKLKVKSICFVFFLIFSLLFGFGIKYIDKTISFLDVINNELSQKEEYYVSVLKDSEYKKINNFVDKKIAIYVSNKEIVEKVSDLLKKENINELVEYDDVILMFEDLSEKKVDAVIVNSSIDALLASDLSYMKLELENIHTLMVPIHEEEVVKVVDVTNTPFNIYIAGGDAYGSINRVTNTDVNMVVTVDPVNHKLLLTSIPRDYYVNLPSKGENAYDKLTHAGYYGIGESVKTVEKLLDIDINYYVKVNFSTIVNVIDAIGGVTVYSDYNFREDSSGYGYYYKKGPNKLNGKKALAFARERHAFAAGDVQRVKNQQKVLTAVIDKMTSSTSLITNYSDILDSVKKSFSTNLDTKSINRLVKMQLNDMRGWEITSQNLIGTGSKGKTYTFPGMDLYVMKQNEESVNEAREKIKEVVDLNIGGGK